MLEWVPEFEYVINAPSKRKITDELLNNTGSTNNSVSSTVPVLNAMQLTAQLIDQLDTFLQTEVTTSQLPCVQLFSKTSDFTLFEDEIFWVQGFDTKVTRK